MPPLTNLTASLIDGHEPQRVNNCLLRFDLSGLGTAGYAMSNYNSGPPQGPSFDTTGQDLLISIDRFPLPKEEVGVIQLGYLNEKRKYAGNPAYSDLQVEYKDFVDLDTAGQLYYWFTCVNNPITGQTNYKNAYAVNGFAYIYPPDGTAAPQPPRQYNLFGCWCSSHDPGDNDQSGEDYVRVGVTIRIDKAYRVNYTGGTTY